MDTVCPACRSPMVKRVGRLGEFWGCTRYPECKFTQNIVASRRVTARVASRAADDFQATLEFVQKVGGLGKAFRLLDAVTTVLGAPPSPQDDVDDGRAVDVARPPEG